MSDEIIVTPPPSTQVSVLSGQPGPRGIQGEKGEKGDPGSDGPSGVISVTSPVTNTGTPTAAELGLDQTALSIGQSQVSGLSTALSDKASLTSDNSFSGGNVFTSTDVTVPAVTVVASENGDLYNDSPAIVVHDASNGNIEAFKVDAKGRVTAGTVFQGNPSYTNIKIGFDGITFNDTAFAGINNAPSISIREGASTQFLKADGSLDSTSYASLDGSGKVPSSQLPAMVINETYVVGSEAEMLALTANVGDLAVRTDLSGSFILQTADASVLSNWVELLTPPGIPSIAGSSDVVLGGSYGLSDGDLLTYNTGGYWENRPLDISTYLSDYASLSNSQTFLGSNIFSGSQDFNGGATFDSGHDVSFNGQTYFNHDAAFSYTTTVQTLYANNGIGNLRGGNSPLRIITNGAYSYPSRAVFGSTVGGGVSGGTTGYSFGDYAHFSLGASELTPLADGVSHYNGSHGFAFLSNGYAVVNTSGIADITATSPEVSASTVAITSIVALNSNYSANNYPYSTWTASHLYSYTVTTPSAHGFVVGDVIRIAGTSQANFNGNCYTVDYVPSGTTFNITNNSPIGDATGGTAALAAALSITAHSGKTQTPLVIKAAASQTATLTEWRNSSGTAIAKVDSAGSVTASSFTASAGTTTRAPITLTSGTNLSSQAAGALEYNGNTYLTNDTTAGRGVALTSQFIYMSSGASVATGGQFFTSSVRPQLVSGHVYKIRAELLFTVGGTSPTVTWGFTPSVTGFTNLYASATTIIRGTALVVVGNATTIYNSSSTATTSTSTGSLSTSSTYYTVIEGFVVMSATSRLQLIVTLGGTSPTLTSVAGSNMTITDMGPAGTNIGNIG